MTSNFLFSSFTFSIVPSKPLNGPSTTFTVSPEVKGIAIPFTSGETVKVVDGPFNGFDGTIEKVNEEKRKLEVMVKIFGRKTPLEL